MEIHPIRATLAIGALAVTAYLLIAGVEVIDAWWALVGGVFVFYFTSNS